MGTWFNVLILIHQEAHFLHNRVECLGLVSMYMVASSPHIVDTEVGVGPKLSNLFSCAAVHPRPCTIDQSEGNGGVEVRSNALDHRPLGPADGDLHVVECCLATGQAGRQADRQAGREAGRCVHGGERDWRELLTGGQVR